MHDYNEQTTAQTEQIKIRLADLITAIEEAPDAAALAFSYSN
jgi:hypothetical protein